MASVALLVYYRNAISKSLVNNTVSSFCGTDASLLIAHRDGDFDSPYGKSDEQCNKNCKCIQHFANPAPLCVAFFAKTAAPCF